MAYTFEDVLIRNVPQAGLWVKLVNLVDGVTSYVSPARSADVTGKISISGITKPGHYVVWVSELAGSVAPAAGDASWRVTTRTVVVGPYDDTDTAIIRAGDVLTEDSLALNSFVPADYGLKAWTFDPVMWASGFVLTPAGTLFWQRIHVRKAISVSQLVLFINSAGVGLVAGQCFGLLYGQTPTFSQIAFTSDQSANWQSTGYKAMNFSGGPFNLTPGDYFSVVYYNGTTGPGFGRAGGSNIINGSSVMPVTRFGTANTGVTNVAPGALSGMVPFNAALWAALA